jgi:lysyl-tRNA synthetase class II
MTADNSPAQEDDLPEQLRIRREKRASLLERGIEPYPVAVARTKSLSEIREKYVNVTLENFALQRCARVMEQSYKRCYPWIKSAKHN